VTSAMASGEGLKYLRTFSGFLVPGLGHQHQQARPGLAQMGQRGMAVLVQVPARARPAHRGVLVQQSARYNPTWFGWRCRNTSARPGRMQNG
jgi:hypothetical protein